MATNKSVDPFEFQCPQFVDFTEVDSSPRDANQFGGFSPDLRNAAPLLNIPGKSTSRRKVYPDCKKNIPFQQTPVTHSTNNTDSDKWRLTALSKRLSKSEGSINHCSRNLKAPAPGSSHFPVLKRHNRSLSEGDRAKARIFPTTPLCLKRTLYKSKLKKFKTSEELELEKIAELRKEMAKHLRANEMAMRRLKMKVRTCTVIQKEVNKPELKSNNYHQVNKPKVTDNKGLGKLNGFRQNTSPPNVKDRIDAERIKTERAKRFQTRVNELKATVCRPLSENLSGKHNSNPTVASASGTSGWSSLKNKNTPYAAHPGLCFLPKQQKAKTCERFNFIKKDSRSVQSCTSQGDILKKDQGNVPGTRNFTGKENNTSQKSLSEVKRVKDQKLKTPFHSKDNRI